MLDGPVVVGGVQPDHVVRRRGGLRSRGLRDADGLALARQLAMTTYRGSEEFSRRFAAGSGRPAMRSAMPVPAW